MLARRVAALLVVAALGWLSIGSAHAAEYPNQGLAYLACKAAVADAMASFPPSSNGQYPQIFRDCTPSGSTGYTCVVYANNNSTPRCREKPGDPWSTSVTFKWKAENSCDKLPSFTSTFQPKSGSVGCNAGCEVAWYGNGDGTSTAYHLGTVCQNETMPQTCTGDYYWNPRLNVCEPTRPECKAGEAPNAAGHCAPEACPAGMIEKADGTCGPKAEECPAGNVKAPSGECLPGEGQCAAGEVRRDNGTCGKDSDGDGVADVDDDDPDNDPKESASGGDTCDAPPSCNGGAIDCMQLRIQWRIDCNTRRNRNVSGGSCSSVPVCTGEKCDALEYAQLLQQWRATCALEKIAAKGDGTGGGGGDAGVVDLLTGPGSINSNAGGGDSLEEGNPWADEGEEYEPDASGYGWSRSCPSPPSFTLPGGQSVQINLTPLCNWVSLGGSLVLILAGLLSLRIVSGGNA